jgi:hypothetical protein
VEEGRETWRRRRLDGRRSQAARERLAGPLISAVGELGVAVAAEETATAGVPAAQEQAREHMRRAQREAEEMVAAACARVAAADDGYRTAHEAAIDAGWSATALTDMGYPPARAAGASSRRQRAGASRSTSVRKLPAADRRYGTSRTQNDGDVDETAAPAAS